MSGGLSKAARVQLLQGLERDLADALDPETARARAEWEQNDLKRRAWERDKREGAKGKSGWRRGQPQCPSCHAYVNQADGWCASCRTYNGVQSHARG